MTGEMSKSELTADAYPCHFAIAKELGGTVEPFDQYQGPYIQLDGARLWIACADGIGGYVWNETTRCKSEEFFLADMEHTEEAVAAAREVYPSGGIDVDAPESLAACPECEKTECAHLGNLPPDSVRKGETLIYDGGQCGLSATHDDSGVVYMHFAGIGWASITPDQAAEFASKLSTAVFPFQRTARNKESKSCES